MLFSTKKILILSSINRRFKFDCWVFFVHIKLPFCSKLNFFILFKCKKVFIKIDVTQIAANALPKDRII